VPLGTDPREYFEEEVAPYLENAWINESKKYHDDEDGELGVVGYEINFDRYFYEYEAPRDLDEINSEIREQRNRITDILEELEI
jgi:type I restriction enzyme M protein